MYKYFYQIKKNLKCSQESDKSSGDVSFTLILSKKRLWQETWKVVVLAEFQRAEKTFVSKKGYNFDLKTKKILIYKYA